MAIPPPICALCGFRHSQFVTCANEEATRRRANWERARTEQDRRAVNTQVIRHPDYVLVPCWEAAMHEIRRRVASRERLDRVLARVSPSL